MNEFAALVEPHRTMLRLHCYRMLGSAHDSDDMVQETFVRAFRSHASLADPSAVGGWLHRIATNVCLDELQKRPRRARGPELGPPVDPDSRFADRLPEEVWIEPMPSAWLAGADPASAYSLQESVALAFVAALQILTPAQRAVLLLRDVVGLSAEETAEALAVSLSAANSTLHRARVAIEKQVGPIEHREKPVDRELLERYLRAWRSGELEAILSLLHQDAVLSMPPRPVWLAGIHDLRTFFGNPEHALLRSGAFVFEPLEANGTCGLALYRLRDRALAALHLLAMRDGRIVAIDHFMSGSAHTAFVAAGLPATL